MSGLKGQIVFFPEREVISPFRPVCHSLDSYYSRDHAVRVGVREGGPHLPRTWPAISI